MKCSFLNDLFHVMWVISQKNPTKIKALKAGLQVVTSVGKEFFYSFNTIVFLKIMYELLFKNEYIHIYIFCHRCPIHSSSLRTCPSAEVWDPKVKSVLHSSVPWPQLSVHEWTPDAKLGQSDSLTLESEIEIKMLTRVELRPSEFGSCGVETDKVCVQRWI